MRSLLALGLVAWTFVFARGITRRMLPAAHRDGLTLSLTAGAFGLGLLTLIPFWIMLVAPGLPAFAIASIASIVIWGADRISGPLTRRVEPEDAFRPQPEGPAGMLDWALTLATAVSCAAIVFDATFWPFDHGDALALYAPFGKHLFTFSTLPIGDRLYESYPMLVPMAYALTHWAAGGANEYVARLVPAVMAVGAVAGAGAVARDMRGRRAGLVAAAVMAVTPVVGRWATTGYTDVPAALYVSLTVLFAWRWWCTGHRNALGLAGIAAGLAMWTKNSTLALIPSLVWLVLCRSVLPRDASHPRAAPDWSAIAVLIGTTTLVAAPWYLRNWLVFGFLVPPTILTDRAQHSSAVLLTMLRGDTYFGVSGWVFTAALPYALFRIGRDGVRRAAASHVLMMFAAPFLLGWWWLASYEARFLMTVLPLVAVLAALMIDDAAAVFGTRLSVTGTRRALGVAAILVVVAATVAVRKTVEHKAIIASHPWLSDADRHRVRLGGLYDLAVGLNRLPSGSRVGGVPSIIRYHLDLRRFSRLDWASASGPADAGAYDYVVVRRVVGASDEPHAANTPTVETADGYLLLSTRPDATQPDTTAMEPR